MLNLPFSFQSRTVVLKPHHSMNSFHSVTLPTYPFKMINFQRIYTLGVQFFLSFHSTDMAHLQTA